MVQKVPPVVAANMAGKMSQLPVKSGVFLSRQAQLEIVPRSP